MANGDKAWEKFNQKDKTKHEWYYCTIIGHLAELSRHMAYREFCMLVDAVFCEGERHEG